MADQGSTFIGQLPGMPDGIRLGVVEGHVAVQQLPGAVTQQHVTVMWPFSVMSWFHSCMAGSHCHHVTVCSAFAAQPLQSYSEFALWPSEHSQLSTSAHSQSLQGS
jgi:hypothetical protein